MRKSRLRPVGVAIGSRVFIGILIVFFFTLAATTGEQGLPRVRFLVFLASAVVLVSMFATAQMTKLAVMGRVQQVLAKTFTTGEVHTVLRRLAKEYGDVCSGEINLQGWSSRDGDEAAENIRQTLDAKRRDVDKWGVYFWNARDFFINEVGFQDVRRTQGKARHTDYL